MKDVAFKICVWLSESGMRTVFLTEERHTAVNVHQRNTMGTQLIFVTICIYLCGASAQDLDSSPEIRSELRDLIKGTEELNIGVENVKNVQKGIEEKFKHQRDEIDLIAQLGVALAVLDTKVQGSFEATGSGVSDLTAIIKAVQSQNEQSIQNLTKVDLAIRSALEQVAVNHNKYEKDLDAVTLSVNSNLAEIQQLISQRIVGDLIGLDNKAKILGEQQRNIIGQVGHLGELNALADRANRKVNQLEWGLVLLNRTQSESLSGIENTVHAVQVATSQIDRKLGALLDNQKSIAETLEGCKRKSPPNQKPYETWTHPEYVPNYQPKPEEKSGYESSYASEEEAERLYKLLYGKGQQE
ncbi:uncharacterized protein LOC119546324 [Drosophila subpulchrella]|uniref:uncharacterized protein LOC119546324 n=1 Tax=Drosophila subpulchrella TaxID=1486046 RepID=UPI0018A163C0|nr:uncharacterized protein LOC119546324 [Drosophila subpulchrella]